MINKVLDIKRDNCSEIYNTIIKRRISQNRKKLFF